MLQHSVKDAVGGIRADDIHRCVIGEEVSIISDFSIVLWSADRKVVIVDAFASEGVEPAVGGIGGDAGDMGLNHGQGRVEHILGLGSVLDGVGGRWVHSIRLIGNQRGGARSILPAQKLKLEAGGGPGVE